jgi:hypothetical protein
MSSSSPSSKISKTSQSKKATTVFPKVVIAAGVTIVDAFQTQAAQEVKKAAWHQQIRDKIIWQLRSSPGVWHPQECTMNYT